MDVEEPCVYEGCGCKRNEVVNVTRRTDEEKIV